MFNRFFILKITVCRFSSEGWIRQHGKEDIIEEFNIPLIDVNQFPYIKGPVMNIKLTINLARSEAASKKSYEDCCINIDVIHEAAFIGNFVAPPSNFIEGDPKPERATLDDFRIISKRLRRLRIVFEKFFGVIGHLFSWKYPKISAILMVLYIAFAVFLPSQLALPLIIFILTAFLILMSPYCNDFRRNFKKKYLRVSMVSDLPKIITIKEYEFDQKQNFDNFKMKDKEGVLLQIKKIRVDLDELVEILMDIVSYAEKIRNLFLWEDPQKSLYFAVGLITVIYLLYSVPFRLLVLLIGVLKFLSGMKKAKSIRKSNEKLCKDVLSSLYGAYLQDCFVTVTQERPWSKDFLENTKLQRKIIKGLRSKLAVNVDTDIFKLCENPNKLYNALSSCEMLLKLRLPSGHIAESSKKISRNLLSGFLSNIPSEYFRYLHPRLTNIQAAN